MFNSLENELKSINNLKWRNFNLCYFHLHKYSFKDNLEILDRYYTGGKILEIGASPFHMSYCLKKLGYNFISLDISPEKYKNFIKKQGFNVKKCNIEKNRFPFSDNTFDIILLNNTFEHLTVNPIFALMECRRVLKPEGVMILRTPNLYSLQRIILFNLGVGFEDPYNGFRQADTLGYKGHIRVYSNREIRRFLEKTGFKISKTIYKISVRQIFVSSRYTELFFENKGYRLNLFMKGLIKTFSPLCHLLMCAIPKYGVSQIIISTAHKR